MAEPSLNPDNSRFTAKVNGVEIEFKQAIVTAIAILEMAKEQGAIPGQPESYVLEGDKGRYSGNDKVDLREDFIFITVPDTPTPVA